MTETTTAIESDAASPARPRLEFWAIDRLVPLPRNARTHSPAQIAEIAGSIRAFGFTNPILAGDDGDVIAGHGRLAAARRLGLAEVPVIRLKGLNEVQRRQLVVNFQEVVHSVLARNADVAKPQRFAENRMDTHKNARLTPKGREAMVRAVVDSSVLR